MPRRSKPSPSATPHACAWEGCGMAGEFRAPKHRHLIGSNKPNDYVYFCQEHIKAFNKSWDFFAGMSQEEIEAFMWDAVTGHRPTWNRESRTSRKKFSTEDLLNAFDKFQGFSYHAKEPHPQERNVLTPEQVSAFAALNLPQTAGADEVKKRYKSLVKQLHPDVNNGDKHFEERFKQVTEAYRCLRHMEQG